MGTAVLAADTRESLGTAAVADETMKHLDAELAAAFTGLVGCSVPACAARFAAQCLPWPSSSSSSR